MYTDTSERGLEHLICTTMTGSPCEPPKPDEMAEQQSGLGTGWIPGDPAEYDREYCVDLKKLSAFLTDTQPKIADALDLGKDGPTRRKFLARLEGEINKRGTIDVLRHGIKHGPHQIDLFHGAPSPGNLKARARYGANRFSVTRQLRYSRDETQLSLALCLFINGLPIATFELKNSLTKQTVEDAIEHDKALTRVMTGFLKDDTELFKRFMDDESFRRWMTDTYLPTRERSPGLRFDIWLGEKLEQARSVQTKGGSFKSRVPCSDESCVGIIGPAGRCGTCGKPFKAEAKGAASGDLSRWFTKMCPSCAEEIKLEAIRCRFCGKKFDPEDVARQVRAREEYFLQNRGSCSDDGCVGIIGPTGRCGTCGKPSKKGR
jgi:hypothetical protein